MSLPAPISNLQNYNDQVVQINDILYYYNILLFNPDYDVVRIKQSAIKTLYIEDDISNFYQEGYLIYDNKFDVIESLNSLQPGYSQTPSLVDGTLNGTVGKGYRYRGDARDFLIVDIMPEIKPGTIKKGEMKKVVDLAKKYNKTKPAELRKLLLSGDYRRPLIIKFGDRYHLVAGNTRLCTAAALGVKPKVLIGEI
jgi:hypothetical protein